MVRPRSILTIALSAAILSTIFNTGLRAEVTATEVRESIERGVAFLKQRQNADGAWNEWTSLSQPGGVTALCTLALLNAGVEVKDPCIQRALNCLRKIPSERTYVVSLQTQVLARAEPEKDRFLINRNVRWLEATQIDGGNFKGAWSYPGAAGDNSNAQFAMLALYEAERVGVPASEQTWRLARSYWEKCQNKDGSWGYYAPFSGTGSMTTAGITSLVIAADRLQEPDAAVDGERIHCCGSTHNEADPAERGLQWLGRNFSVTNNPGNESWLLYYLYGMERTGRLSAQRFIGEHDWYREGADALVRKQDRLSGYWIDPILSRNNQPLVGTSFALLFLAKGRWPVLLSKVKHGNDGDWNQHRHDAINLTRFAESRWKKDMTWQVVDWEKASVEELLQSPVLYLCGSADFLPDDQRKREALAQKTRDYLDRGGFLFAEGYCGKIGFDRCFQEFMKLVFPEKEYQLRLLDADHPIWRAEEVVPADQLRPLWGVDFGCRTSVVYAPLDPLESPRPSLSCLWELHRSGRAQKYAESVQQQINAGMAIGLNVLAYATNRELRGKEEFFSVKKRPQGAEDRTDRGKLIVAKLRHPGGCNAAPRALSNLLEAAGEQLRLRAAAKEDLIDLTDESLFDCSLAFMQGRNAFRLTDAERKQLKLFAERGGTVFADSICANQAFADSFRAEMSAVFGAGKLEKIPSDDPLLTTKYGGFDLKIVSRRDPQARAKDAPLAASVKKAPPELEGIKIDGRWAIIFSPYDVSCSLEKHDSVECRGYVREDAARIGVNVLLYALQQ